jgi:hypothetical protein
MGQSPLRVERRGGSWFELLALEAMGRGSNGGEHSFAVSRPGRALAARTVAHASGDSIGRLTTIHQTSYVSRQAFADQGNRCGAQNILTYQSLPCEERIRCYYKVTTIEYGTVASLALAIAALTGYLANFLFLGGQDCLQHFGRVYVAISLIRHALPRIAPAGEIGTVHLARKFISRIEMTTPPLPKSSRFHQKSRISLFGRLSWGLWWVVVGTAARFAGC